METCADRGDAAAAAFRGKHLLVVGWAGRCAKELWALWGLRIQARDALCLFGATLTEHHGGGDL